MSLATRMAEVADTVGGLGIAVHTTEESGPYAPGLNLWRMTRPDLPTRSAPYRGVVVAVMYEPQTESEERYEEWAARVRAALLAAYPDRYRPIPFAGLGTFLIEDPDTPYTRWRTAENAKRASLGWEPLHEIGK